MYRSVAWKFLQTGKAFDEDFISGLSKTMLIDFKPEAKIKPSGGSVSGFRAQSRASKTLMHSVPLF